MMRKTACIFLCVFLGLSVTNGQGFIDSLRNLIRRDRQDTNEVVALSIMANYHAYNHPDSNRFYVQKTINLSKKINFPRGLVLASTAQFYYYNLKADYPKALQEAQYGLSLASSLPYDRLYNMALAELKLALVMREMHNIGMYNQYVRDALNLQAASGKLDGDFWGGLSNKASLFMERKSRDSAIYFARRSQEIACSAPSFVIYSCLATARLAEMYQGYGMYDLARDYYEVAFHQAAYHENTYIEARIFMNLAMYSKARQLADSAIYFGRKAIDLCNRYHYGDYASTTGSILASIYEARRQPDSALKYVRVMLSAKDSIFNESKMIEFLDIIAENQAKQKASDEARERLQERVKFYSSMAALAVFLMLSAILYYNNRQKHKAYTIIRKQKQEADLQKARVEKAYEDLQATQQQLIQSEKMASLGELTAGIAHEIQNPMNFINNFSELNTELMDDMESTFRNGDPAQAFAIAADIRKNLEKINHHGKRADEIVKSMLQHSRLSTGQKEWTDINALADEYFRLSYHGMRARNKDFQSAMVTALDPAAGRVLIVPRDIGRVLLNLFNNAFYSVNEKKKKNGASFEPQVQLSSRRTDHGIEIRVRDNGLGVPQKIREKIFQPFFTTKPAGQGTGLGLSLSYDIVVKEHGGSFALDSTEGEYAEFIITLPVTRA